MGEFELAIAECERGVKLVPSNTEMRQLLREIIKVDLEKTRKQQTVEQETRKKLTAHWRPEIPVADGEQAHT